MLKILERFQKRVINLLNKDDEDSGIAEARPDIMSDIVFLWIFRNVMPVLLIALLINIVIIFAVPAEVTMSRWFCLKDPLSIALGFIIAKATRFLFKGIS